MQVGYIIFEYHVYDIILIIISYLYTSVPFCKLQVDYVIKEARDLDNLAVLYEGWTPWV